MRPDLKKALQTETFPASDIVKRFVLNEHYFITEAKAIAYLKLHCGGIVAAGNGNISSSTSSDNESDDSRSVAESELSYQALKRRRISSSIPIGIDDIAVVAKK